MLLGAGRVQRTVKWRKKYVGRDKEQKPNRNSEIQSLGLFLHSVKISLRTYGTNRGYIHKLVGWLVGWSAYGSGGGAHDGACCGTAAGNDLLRL